MMRKEIPLLFDDLERIVHLSEYILQSNDKSIDFRRIIEDVLAISGAKYACMNLYDNEGIKFTTVALSGSSEIVAKATRIMGNKIVGRTYLHNAVRAEKIKGATITRFKSLTELSGDVLPRSIVAAFEKIFNLGESVLIKIEKNQVMLGDFEIFMEKGKYFDKDEAVTIYTRQVGTLLVYKNELSKAIERENLYTSLFSSVIEPLLLIDQETSAILDVNEAACRVYGYSRSEMLNLRVTDISAEPEITKQAIKEKITRIPLRFHKKKDGTVFPIELIIRSVTLNKRALLLSFILDISERLQAEKEMKESEEKFRLLFSGMDQGVALHEIIVDDEGQPIDYRYLDINESYTKLVGVTREMTIGKTIKEVMPNVEQYWIDVFGKVALTGESTNYENFLETTGKYYSTYTYSPKKNQFAVIVSDISERKNAENTLRKSEKSLISAQTMAHVGNWEINLDDETVWASEEYFRIYGFDYTSPYLTLKTARERAVPEFRELLATSLANLITKNEPYNIEYKIRDFKTGEEKFIHSIAEVSMNESGKITKVIGTLQDITARKKQEEEITKLSYHDYLTGLYNRRFYEEELNRLDTERNLPLTVIMGDVNGLKLINDSFGHDAGDELLMKAAKAITDGCRADDIIARHGGDEFVILLPKTDALKAEIIIMRIQALAEKQKVRSADISFSLGYAVKHTKEEKIEDVFKSAENQMYKKKLYDSPSMRGKAILSIMNALYEKNAREEAHSRRVSTLCERMGVAMGFPKDKVKELKMVGLLHDIGKIAIDESILSKPTKLNENEWEEMKRHPEIGYRILNTNEDMIDIAGYVLAHHERWDGKGYPKGLKGEEIPIESRIITIVDSYDAMTNLRSYKDSLPQKIAIEELQNNSGTQFDPELVKIFIEKVSHYKFKPL